METMVKKQQNKYRKAREDIARWEDLQSRLLTQFGNASSIIERLPVLMHVKNHGSLQCIIGSKEALIARQIESLEGILYSMKETMKEFYGIVKSLEKLWRDCHQQLKGGSAPSVHQMHLQLGIQPSLTMCLDGLKEIYEMYYSEYLLKHSLVSVLTWNSTPGDVGAARQLLNDQPNIPKDEVMLLFDTILPEDLP